MEEMYAAGPWRTVERIPNPPAEIGRDACDRAFGVKDIVVPEIFWREVRVKLSKEAQKDEIEDGQFVRI
jgi:hypothetical protein